MICLIQKFKHKIKCDHVVSTPTIQCTLFKDNTGALELANTPKMRPCTRHINIKYYHFRQYVRNKFLMIKSVRTTEQLADIFTKPLPRDLNTRFRDKILTWEATCLPNQSTKGV